jgi:hypothetical protein
MEEAMLGMSDEIPHGSQGIKITEFVENAEER